MEVKTREFGRKTDKPVTLFRMKNSNGLEISCINFGCIITEIIAPDKNGNRENIVLGFDSMEEYELYSPYFGAVVGRVAGRIKNGNFELDGTEYQLSQNDNQNHLHGGVKGFNHVLWDANVVENEVEASIESTYVSLDGEEGYPGNLEMNVTYTLNHRNEFFISYQAKSDKKTLLNITNHTYFNLSGELKRDILHHELTIDSDQILELNEDLLPTGNVINVEDTVFDFRKGRKLIDGVHSSHPQNVLVSQGYDHPFLLNANHRQEICLVDEVSGRKLVVETDEPCVVLYTGNKMGNDYDIRGVRAKNHLGVCLETQRPPDSIHHPHFPSVILEEGKEYQSTTKYLFTW